MVESDNGALSVACAHWPTNLSGSRRCTLLRYVSEDGSPPPGMEVRLVVFSQGWMAFLVAREEGRGESGGNNSSCAYDMYTIYEVYFEVYTYLV